MHAFRVTASGYRAVRADRMAHARTRRPRPCLLARNEALRRYVEEGLKQRWSPQQIAARLKLEFPDDPTMRVSHETIYTSLFVQAKAGLPGQLTVHLRTRRVRRRPQRRPSVGPKRIPDMRPLAKRPIEVNDRTDIGHWEGDLIVGRRGGSHIGTLVERHSRYVLLLHLGSARTDDVIAALTATIVGLPAPLRRTLTWDQGVEMTNHRNFTRGASSAEGVAIGRGSTFYAGELFGGDIFRGDLQRGTAELFIDAPPGQMALGLKVDDPSGLLFVAGGFSGQGYVYDAMTGAALATYEFGTPGMSIVNDVVITRDGAWFTDSVQPMLYFVPISPTGVPGDFSVLTLTGPAADTTGDFNLNGIAATPDGRTLIVAHSTNEALYTVDPLTGASELLVGDVAPDGILYEAGRLWVAEPFLNQVTRLRPNPDLTDAVVEEIITSDLFQTPSTIAVHGDQLAAVNAKFDTGFPPTADEYEVVLVER